MAWRRQIGLFILAGIVQLGIDTGVVVLLTAVGVPLIVANVAGRFAGAVGGFVMNGGATFSDADGRKLGRRYMTRYAFVWLAMTAISTTLLSALHAHVTLGWVWLAKPVLEAGLAVVSFLLSRHWIYR
jgi:putative flippase GtrA